MRTVVVGGGLAGCAAALELLDAGHRVTLLEARPTLGGAVQTLPKRDGDPAPPPDNGQHIALGCFTEYLAFLDRIGEAGSVRRLRLSLPVVDERREWAQISPASILLARYTHLPLRDRPLAWQLFALRGEDPNAHDHETFADFLRARGQSQRAIERFWDVFIRPALNLRSAEASAAMGLFTVQTALLGGRRAGELVLPAKPLGSMHGDAARRVLERRGATVETGARVEALDELDGDAVVVATPPAESARLLGEPAPELEPSPIVSVHLLFDRPLLRTPLAALLDSDAHWIFDRGALTGHAPAQGQYLTVVSSGVPELMEIRGRELVDRIAAQVTERLGRAELGWARVSREPNATVALRPGTAALRPGARTSLPNVTRAGAWTATGWPATMESAVRSGRTAARLLSNAQAKVAA
ncbi:MAG TPA: hydroxysqualene dehydroxylase HpnE [Gaiellaceae bacterium]|nr:hydroxysqualene dehydroxylase HpnE [Gaiellaceae bacterium]